MIAEALRALYDLAPKCDVCEEHVATREGFERLTGQWLVCDRVGCGERIECVASGPPHDPPKSARAVACAWCGSARRVPRAPSWRDLPHAAALRAANAAHEAGR